MLSRPHQPGDKPAHHVVQPDQFRQKGRYQHRDQRHRQQRFGVPAIARQPACKQRPRHQQAGRQVGQCERGHTDWPGTFAVADQHYRQGKPHHAIGQRGAAQRKMAHAGARHPHFAQDSREHWQRGHRAAQAQHQCKADRAGVRPGQLRQIRHQPGTGGGAQTEGQHDAAYASRHRGSRLAAQLGLTQVQAGQETEQRHR